MLLYARWYYNDLLITNNILSCSQPTTHWHTTLLENLANIYFSKKLTPPLWLTFARLSPSVIDRVAFNVSKFQIFLPSISLCCRYLYISLISPLYDHHLPEPTPTTIQCHKLQPIYTCIAYVQPHFLMSHYTNRRRTSISVITQTNCAFVLPFINYTFLHFLCLYLTLSEQTVSFTEHANTCTNLRTFIFTLSYPNS